MKTNCVQIIFGWQAGTPWQEQLGENLHLREVQLRIQMSSDYTKECTPMIGTFNPICTNEAGLAA